MDRIHSFIQANKSFFEIAQALSALVNLFVWVLALGLLVLALRKNRVESLSVGPFLFRMRKEEAIAATAAASRAWQTTSGAKTDVPRIRATLDRGLTPQVVDNLTGKLILWADDNPANNELAVRALRKLGLDVQQVESTEAAVDALSRRAFHLVISDMGRGENMRAGYDLLAQLRSKGSTLPFFIFAGSDTPEYRREAAARGAQLSTNDMLELVDRVISVLGHDG